MKQYLKDYPPQRLLGISHEAYMARTLSLNKNYDSSNMYTKYEYTLIEHINDEKYALEIEYTTYLPEIFLDRLTTHEQMESDGWFPAST
jgi:type IV secretory pathway VirB4 component